MPQEALAIDKRSVNGKMSLPSAYWEWCSLLRHIHYTLKNEEKCNQFHIELKVQKTTQARLLKIVQVFMNLQIEE